MNSLDVIIIACMIFLVVRGLFRGFIKEVGSLAGVILGIWLGSLFQPRMNELLEPFLPWGKFLSLISFGLIFLVVLVLCNLLGWLGKKLASKIFLGWADRGLGGALAVLKGVIITYFAIVLLTFFVPSKSHIIADSKLAPIIIRSYQSVTGLLSPDAYRRLKERFVIQKKRVEEAIAEGIQ